MLILRRVVHVGRCRITSITYAGAVWRDSVHRRLLLDRGTSDRHIGKLEVAVANHLLRHALPWARRGPVVVISRLALLMART